MHWIVKAMTSESSHISKYYEKFNIKKRKDFTRTAVQYFLSHLDSIWRRDRLQSRITDRLVFYPNIMFPCDNFRLICGRSRWKMLVRNRGRWGCTHWNALFPKKVYSILIVPIHKKRFVLLTDSSFSTRR